MNKEDKFLFEHEKPNPKIEGHVSTHKSISQLLVSLLGLNQVQGQIIYDGAIGVGGLSACLDTRKNVLLGDDLERKYLRTCQKNIPSAILFNHDVFKCQGVPCYEHLVSPQWKKKVVNYSEKLINQQTDEALIFNEIQSYRGWTPEQIKEELVKKELELKQRTLEILIKQEAEEKSNLIFAEPTESEPEVVEQVENKVLSEVAELEKEVKKLQEEITEIEEDNLAVMAQLKKMKRIEQKKVQLEKELNEKQKLLKEALLCIDMSKLKKYE